MARPPKKTAPPHEAFARYLTRAAIAAGYDMEVYGSGRKTLADRTGMSVTALGRVFNGQSLPRPENLSAIAEALGLDNTAAFRAAGLLPDTPSGVTPDGSGQQLVSVSLPVPPDQVADLMGVTHPMVRSGLLIYLEQALEIQREFDRGTTGGTAATGGR